MKVRIPSRAKGITLRQYLDYQGAVNDAERLVVISDLSMEQAVELPAARVTELLGLFAKASNTFERYTPTVVETPHGKLGFIPDLSSMSLGEFMDLDEYAKSCYVGNNLSGADVIPMLSVLFRPVEFQTGSYYEIEPYQSEKIGRHRQAVESLDMESVTNALLFFSSLEAKLLTDTLRFLEAQATQIATEVTKEIQDVAPEPQKG